MITYETGGVYLILNIFKWHGSVFPKAAVFSLPNALVTAALVYFVHGASFDTFLRHFQPADSIMNETAIWGGFSFLVGLLVVFRTSQAYSRFWEGCTQMHKMGAEWFDSCSSLMAFCKHSDVDHDTILGFQNMLVRLFSMLHAAALGEIEDCGSASEGPRGLSEVQAFNMEIIDVGAVNKDSLRVIRDSDAKVELIFQWIQQLVVENIKTGVLCIPPPILSRSFQEIANGMVHFHEAMKISNVPFPFPYAQTCDCLLFMHWFIVPFVVSQWIQYPWWAAVFSFIQVFTFWTLNLIAIELENPFGTDPNDIDGAQMQFEMNNHLRLLIRKETLSTPFLVPDGVSQRLLAARAICEEDLSEDLVVSTFHEVWNTMGDEIATRRFSSALSKRGRCAQYADPNGHGSRRLQNRPRQSWLDDNNTDDKNKKQEDNIKTVSVAAACIKSNGIASHREGLDAKIDVMSLTRVPSREARSHSANPSGEYAETGASLAPALDVQALEESDDVLQLRLGEIFDQVDGGHIYCAEVDGIFEAPRPLRFRSEMDESDGLLLDGLPLYSGDNVAAIGKAQAARGIPEPASREVVSKDLPRICPPPSVTPPSSGNHSRDREPSPPRGRADASAQGATAR